MSSGAASETESNGEAARTLQLRRIGLNLAGVLAINLFSVVTGPILARGLGPTSRGVLAAVLLWPAMIGTLLGLGVPDAVTYFVSLGRTDPRAVVRASARLAQMQTVAIALLGAPIIYVAIRHLGAKAVVSALIDLAVMPFLVHLRNLLAALNGLHRYALFNGLQLVMFSLNAAALVVLWATGLLTVRSAVVASAATVLITFVVALLVTGRVLPRGDSVPPRLLGRLFSFGARSQLSAFPHLLNDRVDQVVLSLVVPPRELGLYVVAATIAVACAYVGSAISISVLPTVASLSSPAEQVQAARRSLTLTAVLTLAGGVVLAVLMRPLITIFFGRNYLGALPAARVLVLAAVMISLARVFHALLKGMGRPLDAAASEGSALAVTALGLAVLVPPLGIMGAALTSLAAYTTSVALGAVFAARALGAHPVEFVLPRPSR